VEQVMVVTMNMMAGAIVEIITMDACLGRMKGQKPSAFSVAAAALAWLGGRGERGEMDDGG
jgi:hypothetical protein